MEQVTESSVREFALAEETSGTLFLPAPHPISNHHHSQKRMLVPVLHSKWLVVSFLWKENEDVHEVAKLDEFDFAREMMLEQRAASSVSSSMSAGPLSSSLSPSALSPLDQNK